MIKKIFLIALFFIGLVYILAPGPNQVTDFSPLPGSLKSDEPGDTFQVPDISAFFSDFIREDITTFYQDDFKKKYAFGQFFTPVSLNYPPIAGHQYIRDMLINSTFVEEYVYPFKGSLFVAGYDPEVEAQIKNIPPSKFGEYIYINGTYFKTKTTIRYYHAPLYISLLVFFGTWLSIYAFLEIAEKARKERT